MEVALVQRQKILQQPVAVLGLDGFRVKLHALDGEMAVTHPHDFAIFGLRGNFQAGRQAVALDGQRVIAHHGVRTGQIGEHASAVMGDGAGLAVHDLPRPHDLAAKRGADGLMPQADAQNGQSPGEILQHRHGDTRLGGRAGPGRNDDALGIERRDGFEIELIVAHGVHVLAEFAEILHQVVGKAVVVVDHQQHGGLRGSGKRGGRSAL